MFLNSVCWVSPQSAQPIRAAALFDNRKIAEWTLELGQPSAVCQFSLWANIQEAKETKLPLVSLGTLSKCFQRNRSRWSDKRVTRPQLRLIRKSFNLPEKPEHYVELPFTLKVMFGRLPLHKPALTCSRDTKVYLCSWEISMKVTFCSSCALFERAVRTKTLPY